MNIWHDMQPELMHKDRYTVFIANSMGSTARLTFDGTTGLLMLKHLSDTNVGAPNNTAFLPRTCTQDGLPAETLLLCSQPIPPMTLVSCRPVGLIEVRLQDGTTNQMLLSAVSADEFWGACLTIDEIPAMHRKAIIRWLRYEQQLQREPVTSVEFLGLEQAEAYFDACQQRYLTQYCGKLSR